MGLLWSCCIIVIILLLSQAYDFPLKKNILKKIYF